MSLVNELRAELQRMIAWRDRPKVQSEIDVVPFSAAPEPRDLIAVDGSYAFLWNVGSMWLALVRAGFLRYRLTRGVFRKVGMDKLDRPIMVSTWEDVVAGQSDLHRELYEATRNARERHKEMVNEFRKRVEGELALRAAERHRDVTIALDGSLATFPKEFDYLEEVLAACERNGNLLVGVSKDSMTHAFGSALADEEALGPEDGMAWVRVPPAFEARQRGFLHGDVYFVRLHPRSPKWFRVDVGTFRDRPAYVFGQIAPYCHSALSLGYPYPLVEAHKFAVTVRQFRELYAGEVVRLALKAGMNIGDVLAGLTQVEGRKRGSFHNRLDAIAREVR
jgi:hypothetical protein